MLRSRTALWCCLSVILLAGCDLGAPPSTAPPAAPPRTAGGTAGRARRHSSPHHGAGQVESVGAVTLVRRAGASDLLLVQDRLRIDYRDDRGWSALDCPPLPAPLHLLFGLMGLPALLSGSEVERPAAVVSQSIMAILMAVFVGLCVRSFIAARRARSLK